MGKGWILSVAVPALMSVRLSQPVGASDAAGSCQQNHQKERQAVRNDEPVFLDESGSIEGRVEDAWNQAGWTSDSCTAFPALTALAAT